MFFAIKEEAETKIYKDGILINFNREPRDRAYNLRHAFIDFYSIIKDIENLDFENY